MSILDPPIISIYLPFSICIQHYVYSYRKFSSGDYALLYNILLIYDWFCIYGTSSVDSAVASLNAALQDAMEQATPPDIINSEVEIPPLVFSFLKILY
jgi:hypothetical protein